ncbi:MAG: Glyceraldehyde-3-phosphate dehydrogenase, type I [Candidatus Wolfebacteria bacterium GW2011_GWC1_43_10]|uniref:Glyceraldehyde-3-phosphate dehydrogenase, type I n=2 Tax=Candidatus Wolfeibacteriota TaxID=1752735 RepID=A0A0G1CB55_9BACT|nr:MAG: Glyceraldehyde-3-phosphate dehydrogenase, type I [Candidatus Wolfebacteria bacterium GW2011_GWC1_43_10]KKT22641.1 MAG: Glyceraldehyde-3-phosphate dehydrogenase, type I [Parcubacteria group bacterium GW2011_GWB1_43_8b]OGM89627.1 MAG: type I glyceraldehyde-3-phosphate dehydrogenase [Candidatus Wolfebacteria bacterium GWA1_42_9]
MKIAINGFGRIGRLFFRQALEERGVNVVAINDLGSLENLAYLLKYDTVYRTWNKEIEIDSAKNILSVDGKKIHFLQEKDPTKLPWGALDIDIVIESTGAFESYERAKTHLESGAKRVLLTAPAKDQDGEIGKTILIGLNEDKLSSCKISSNASCTTNAASPVMAVLSKEPGIKKAVLNTVHAYTATQNIVDGPVRGEDYRRGRAAAQNISPSTTGAATAVARALPELEGKFDGIALRVPVICGSVADITFVAKRVTSVEEINEILTKAAQSSEWQGVLKVTKDPIVSSDIIGESYGAIVDLKFTKVIDGDLVKVLSWYDNEWGYASTLVKHLLKIKDVLH